MSDIYRKAYDRRSDWSDEDEAVLLARLAHDALPLIQDEPKKRPVDDIDDPTLGSPSKAYDFSGDYRRQVLGE